MNSYLLITHKYYYYFNYRANSYYNRPLKAFGKRQKTFSK